MTLASVSAAAAGLTAALVAALSSALSSVGNATAAALTAPDAAVGIAELLVAANGADLSSSAKGDNCCKEVTAPETGATAADAVVWAAETALPERGSFHDLLDHRSAITTRRCSAGNLASRSPD
jgi:hypothetical protein